jgi:hypothetical protein
VWPFATSQTLTGLANYLRTAPPHSVTHRDYFEHLLTYARCHEQDGKVYIGEYLDERTGRWLITGPKAERSRYYNHSTFNDLIITGLAGLVPRDDNLLEIDPLIPQDAWDWFCLDGVPYHEHSVTIVWDRKGQRYGRGPGLSIWLDGRRVAHSKQLARVTVSLNGGEGRLGIGD